MPKTIPIEEGAPYPLGASLDGDGVNFAVYSAQAEKVELCLFSSARAKRESARIELPGLTNQVWHGRVAGLKAGQIYGYRVHGSSRPGRGARSNPNKLLLDPYARAIARKPTWNDALYGYPAVDGLPPQSDAVLRLDERDSAPVAALGQVIDGSFDWGDDRPPRTPWRDTLIYEAQVKGLTQLRSDVPRKLRGTYAGLASEPVIEYLLSFGVTAVELLPPHAHLDEQRLVRLGLRNYWGYNTLAFFAPEPSYAAAASPEGVVSEFKQMVRALHKAGIEVLIDVVYNHTCEGNELGPTLSWRGLGESSYYRLDEQHPPKHLDFTGVGNTLDTRNPRVIQLIADSLRYWVEEMHVDGFRFDLAAALGRESSAFERGAGFLDAIGQDPVLSRTKLIAEAWDIGFGGYQVGNFPTGWSEWNGKYRDEVRRFWRGDAAMHGRLATRLAGSSDFFGHDGRAPTASINFITAHDGFTLADLVAYEHKRNDANQEDNRDGESNNHSWNCGVEGPTDDPGVLALRLRQQKNLLATLLLSVGVPMLTAGDERNRSQAGNNNAYCQDNEIGWIDWSLDEPSEELLAFVRRLSELRRSMPAIRRRSFFDGERSGAGALKDIVWYGLSGEALTSDQWHEPERHWLAARIAPEAPGEQTLLMLFNASASPAVFLVPAGPSTARWQVEFDTGGDEQGMSELLDSGERYVLREHSFALLTSAGADETAS